MDNNSIAIYIHWPFCKSKCPYCDFNSHIAGKIDYQKWRSSYIKEIDYFRNVYAGKTISSIFFGGGTPSLMPTFIVSGIINHLAKFSKFSDNIEITLEGNPTSLETQKFISFKSAGINRISIGAQALNNEDLQFLGRQHSVNDAIYALETAQKYFDNYSFDLIYARPDQTAKEWEKELRQALEYGSSHMSLYQLTIEKGTQFYSDYKSGKLKPPSDELSADLYTLTDEIMTDAGFSSYEISNYAKQGFESKHNMTYWQYGDYLGIGPGAHSRITVSDKKRAIMMTHLPEKWLNQIDQKNNAIQEQKTLKSRDMAEEYQVMGLRITDGIDLKRFEEVTGYKINDFVNSTILEKFDGFLQLDDKKLKTTKQGSLVLNSILAEILG